MTKTAPRNIIIFGATSAIAQATASIWAQRGDRLFLVGRTPAKLDAVTRDLQVQSENPESIGQVQADLTRLEDVPELLNKATEFLGGPIEIALIAHGTLGDQREQEQHWEAAHANLQANLISTCGILTYLANHMEPNRRGTIAVISSVAGERGRQSLYVYGTSKAGITAFCEGLRNRLHPSGVRVLTIKPGIVETPMTAHMKKSPLFAKPETIAKGIDRGIRRKRSVIYQPFYWRFVMAVIKAIPEPLFKRLKL